ncbi:hypothetical protein [Paraburkholderia phosphatilytica]|uniref:hypothetical protein n=1 Tax=Paraburkholderia phosphatilytica TaxID=2282883 RepID=UPI000E49ABDE|nr:hypothetical protein [Paraburkholderia phosphatilytica]
MTARGAYNIVSQPEFEAMLTSILIDDALMTARDISRATGVNINTCERKLTRARTNGVIQFVRENKGGKWAIGRDPKCDAENTDISQVRRKLGFNEASIVRRAIAACRKLSRDPFTRLVQELQCFAPAS